MAMKVRFLIVLALAGAAGLGISLRPAAPVSFYSEAITPYQINQPPAPEESYRFTRPNRSDAQPTDDHRQSILQRIYSDYAEYRHNPLPDHAAPITLSKPGYSDQYVTLGYIDGDYLAHKSPLLVVSDIPFPDTSAWYEGVSQRCDFMGVFISPGASIVVLWPGTSTRIEDLAEHRHCSCDSVKCQLLGVER